MLQWVHVNVNINNLMDSYTVYLLLLYISSFIAVQVMNDVIRKNPGYGGK